MRAAMTNPTRLSQLSGPRCALVRLLQTINFGYIQDLDIRGGEPVLAPAPTVVIEVRLDAGVSERPESMLADYDLRSEIVRLMDQLDVVRDGWVHRIDVRFGIPRRVLIERARQEVRR
jgi:hypothetical protein